MGMFSSIAKQAAQEQLTKALEQEIEEVKKRGNLRFSPYDQGVIAGLKRAIELAEETIDTY